MSEVYEEIAQIESYLEGTMPASDKKAFEVRMEHDDALREKVQFQSQMMSGLDEMAARNELQAIHARRFTNQKPWYSNKLSIFISSLLLVGILTVYLWPRGEEMIASEVGEKPSDKDAIPRVALEGGASKEEYVEPTRQEHAVITTNDVSDTRIVEEAIARSDNYVDRNEPDHESLSASEVDQEIMYDSYQSVKYTLSGFKPYHLQLKSGVHIYFSANSFNANDGTLYQGKLGVNVQEHSYILTNEPPVVCDVKISITDVNGNKLLLKEGKGMLVGKLMNVQDTKVTEKLLEQRLQDTTAWRTISPASIPVGVNNDSLIKEQAAQFTLMGKEAKTNLEERYSLFKVDAISMKRTYHETFDLSQPVFFCEKMK